MQNRDQIIDFNVDYVHQFYVPPNFHNTENNYDAIEEYFDLQEGNFQVADNYANTTSGNLHHNIQIMPNQNNLNGFMAMEFEANTKNDQELDQVIKSIFENMPGAVSKCVRLLIKKFKANNILVDYHDDARIPQVKEALKTLISLVAKFDCKKGNRTNLMVYLNDVDSQLYKKIYARKTKNEDAHEYLRIYEKAVEYYGQDIMNAAKKYLRQHIVLNLNEKIISQKAKTKKFKKGIIAQQIFEKYYTHLYYELKVLGRVMKEVLNRKVMQIQLYNSN